MKNAFLVFLLFSSLLVSAQNTGSIKGVVTDSLTKAPEADVLVTLSDSTNRDRIQFTNAAGEYAFTNLPEGIYTLTFVLFGAQPLKIIGVSVKNGQFTVLSPAIRPGRIISCGPDLFDGPYMRDNPSSTTYKGDDIRKMALPR